MTTLTAMLVLSVLGPAEPRAEVGVLTPAQKLAEFLHLSGEPVTTLESASTLSVGAMWIDDANAMALRGAVSVRASRAGKLPLRAHFDGVASAAFVNWGAAKGRAYLVDCHIQGKGKFHVSTSIGDTGAIDSAEKTVTGRVTAASADAIQPATRCDRCRHVRDVRVGGTRAPGIRRVLGRHAEEGLGRAAFSIRGAP
jgi:hypothetical protein